MASGRSPFKDQVRDRRYQRIVEAAVSHPFGTVHVIPLRYPDERVSRKHGGKLKAEIRYQGYSGKIGWQVHPDKTVTISFQVFSREKARQFINAKAARGEKLQYAPHGG